MMLEVGSLVVVVDKGIDMEGVEGLLVVNEIITRNYWAGADLLELRNSDGEYFGLTSTALESV
jgi:hypothetical protein